MFVSKTSSGGAFGRAFSGVLIGLNLEETESMRLSGLCFILVHLVGFRAWSALHPKSHILQSSGGISVELIAAYETTRLRPLINPEVFLPSNVQSLQSAHLGAAMLDAGINNWLQSPEVRGTAFGQTAQAVEHSLKQEISWGASDTKTSNSRPEGNSVSHKLSFNLLPAQSQARIRYEGLFRAEISHTMRDGSTQMEIASDLGERRELVLSESQSWEQRNSRISYRLSF